MVPLRGRQDEVAVRVAVAVPGEVGAPSAGGGRNEDDAGDEVEPLCHDGLQEHNLESTSSREASELLKSLFRASLGP